MKLILIALAVVLVAVQCAQENSELWQKACSSYTCIILLSISADDLKAETPQLGKYIYNVV